MDSAPVKPARKKPDGNPTFKGETNPGSQVSRLRKELEGKIAVLERQLLERDAAEAARLAAIPLQDGGELTASAMRKVLGQDRVLDVGPTQGRLREWLDKDAKGYMAAIDVRADAEGGRAEMEKELEDLRDEVKELRALAGVSGKSDEDTRKVVRLIDEILAGG